MLVAQRDPSAPASFRLLGMGHSCSEPTDPLSSGAGRLGTAADPPKDLTH